MQDEQKSREQLVQELAEMRRRVAELKASEAERKRAEEALLRLSNAARMTADSIVISDEKAIIIDVNEATLDLYGTDDKRDLIGKSSYDLIAPEDREKALAGMQQLLEKGYVKSQEYHVVTPNGPILVEMSIAVLKGVDGEPIGFVGVSRDITERKQAEEALQEYSKRLAEMVEERTKELEEAQEQLVRREKLAVLGQLAGSVGHELRNPLGVISNATYFLQMTRPDADETTREYLDMISAEVHKSDQIVSDLLNLSRTGPAARESIAVSVLVAQALERRPSPENVAVTIDIPADLPPVYVDPRQMGQVLGNLITNAYQAMPPPAGGRLTIRARAEGGRVALAIADTGCGIPEENMAKIFEPLFTTRAKGIGLGLAVSRNLVEVNGGSIAVESEVGKGSTFTVRLPIR